MSTETISYELPPAGVYAARVTVVADLGLYTVQQKDQTSPEVLMGIAFELAGTRATNGQPFEVYEKIPGFTDESTILGKTLRAVQTDQESGGWNPDDVLGRVVLVNVVHRTSGGRSYAHIEDVTAPFETMNVPEAENSLLYFLIRDKRNSDGDSGNFAKLAALLREAAIEKRTYHP